VIEENSAEKKRLIHREKPSLFDEKAQKHKHKNSRSCATTSRYIAKRRSKWARQEVYMYKYKITYIQKPTIKFFCTSGLNPPGTPTRGHNRCFINISTAIDNYKFSFFPRIIPMWNALPSEAVNAPTFDQFSAMLH